MQSSRNTLSMATAALHFGCFCLKPRERQLLADGSHVALGDRAFDLLLALASQPGQLVSKAELARSVWPNSVVEEGNLRVHISTLRKILAQYSDGKSVIENVAGRGYCFVPFVRFDREAVDTGIIGREEDIASVSELLRQRKMVTIVGPGGVGKTTVATAVIDNIAAASRWPTAIVDLSTVIDAKLVPSAVASAIGVPVVAQTPLDVVLNALRGKQMTLLFDSCEHVIEAVTRLVEAIRQVAPNISILATSREPLKAEREWVYRLRPLETPTADFNASPGEAMAFSSVELFVARARSSSGTFTLHEENTRAVCEICVTLDGLPLALELAAAQVRFLGVVRLLAELNHRFDILTEGRRMALPRHRTLRAALDWSFDTLSGEEQRALSALSVLRGSFHIEAAVAVCKTDAQNPRSFYPVFGQLVNKSLVSIQSDSEPPIYRLLDSTRQYALEKLTLSGGSDQASERHAAYFKTWLDDAVVSRISVDPTVWSENCRRVIDDIRGALDWAFATTGHSVLACDLTCASMPVWQQLALLAEYQERLLLALRTIESEHQPLPEQKLKLNLAVGFVDAVGGATVMPGPGCIGFAAFARALEDASITGQVDAQLDAFYGLIVLSVKSGDLVSSSLLVDRLDAIRYKSVEGAALFHRLRALTNAYRGHASVVLDDIRESERHYAKLPPGPTIHTRKQIETRCALASLEARVLWEMGFPDDALELSESYIADALRDGDPLSLCHALATGACPVANWSGDEEKLRRFVTLLRETADSQSMGYWRQWGDLFEYGLKPTQTTNVHHLDLEFYNHAALQHEALVTIDLRLLTDVARSRAVSRTAGFALPEILRARGEGILTDRGLHNADMVESLFRKAISIAVKRGAPSWALRSACSLLRLKTRQDVPDEAVNVVSDLLSTFTQGFGTKDLREAVALLDPQLTSKESDRSPSGLILAEQLR